MTAVEIDTHLAPEPNEEESVILWRIERLRMAGYSIGAACMLATRRDVDLHRAVDLAARGCTPSTAVRILL